MKTVVRFTTADRAYLAIEAIELRGIYACPSAVANHAAMKCCVRDAMLGTANDALKAFNLSPEVTTK